MKSRREFLTLAVGTVACAAISAQARKSAARQPIGLQLYTLRQQAESDLPKTLATVRAAGYDEVELYWNVYSHPAPELKRMLRDAGLSAPSGHFDYDGLESKLDYARELGLKYVVCPILPDSMRTSAKSFRTVAERFNQFGEKVQKLGMTLCLPQSQLRIPPVRRPHRIRYPDEEYRPEIGEAGDGLLLDYASGTRSCNHDDPVQRSHPHAPFKGSQARL